jgi:hypothetical protein
MRLGTIKVASFYEVGQTYASLLIYNEGLHEMGQLSEQEYQTNKLRYSKKLVEVQAKLPTKKEAQEQQHLQDMQRTFQVIIAEWDNTDRPLKWREQWIRQAEKYKAQIPEAKLLLDKVADRVFVK